MASIKSKKELCRRRRIALNIIIILIFLFSSLIKIISYVSCDYRYAGLYAKREHGKVVYEEAIPQGISETDEYTKELFKECKDMINSSLKSYVFLNWEQLEKCEIYNFSSSYISTGEKDEYALACYKSNENKVYILPRVCADYEKQHVKRIIIHELMHCLTYSQKIAGTVFYEGVAEVLTFEVCKIYNINFNYEYLTNVWAYRTLENVFGSEATVFLLYTGNMKREIDKYTQEGYGQELYAVLDKMFAYASDEQLTFVDEMNLKYLQKVAQDILAHLTYNYASKLLDKSNANRIIMNFKNEFLLIKESYFQKILYDEQIN